jgi:hypothetical protein
MKNDRMIIAKLNEEATAAKLESLRNTVQVYGQALLPPTARELLRGVRTLDRWLPDFLIKTKAAEVVLVDAKFSYPKNRNHSIEMRALLAALRQGTPVWYVCSFYDSDAGMFYDYKAIKATSVPIGWPCCPSCLLIWNSSTDAQIIDQLLPEHCPRARIDVAGSRTPYFVVKLDTFPATGDPFGLLPRASQPCRVCGGPVLHTSAWPDCHPACHQWPNTGRVYGLPDEVHP